jgi:hypothetical protein
MGCTPSPYLLRGFTHPEAGEFYGSAYSYSLVTATWVNRWETRSLQELAGPGIVDSTERPNVESVRKLVLNALLLLTHYELDPILVEGAPLIRRAKMKGRHFLAELARARFLSELLKKKAFRRVTVSRETEEEPIGQQGKSGDITTGIKYRAHWTRGHWRIVHYGKGLVQQRRIWVLPYRTHGPDDEQ